MKKFIAKSPASKKLLNIAQMSSDLPVNILIIGQSGVGKKILAQHILPDASIFDAKLLEESLLDKNNTIDQYTQLIVTNIDSVLNREEFLEKLINIKIVATTKILPSDIEEQFAIKMDIPPLKEREEDLEALIKIYIDEAKNIYEINTDIKDIDIDLSNNGISLKKSIFKNLFLKSMNDQDMMESLEQFISTKLKEEFTYKDLLEYFEVPLLVAAKKQYKSQLQMASKLSINRITLRKKIDQYFKNNPIENYKESQ